MQLKIKNSESKNLVLLLLIDWLIILGTYLFVRLLFIIFGLHLNTTILGSCLAILPYLFGTLYLWKFCKQQKIWFNVLAVLLPCIIEKIATYLLGAFLYSLSPANITEVMNTITGNEPYTVFITNPSARYLINISFFGWVYILGSIIFCVLMVLFLSTIQKKATK